MTMNARHLLLLITIKSDQPTSTHRNYPGKASNPIWAYRLNGRKCRCKADLDFLAFCALEETTRTTADDLDEDDAERPRLPLAVDLAQNRPLWRLLATSGATHS